MSALGGVAGGDARLQRRVMVPGRVEAGRTRGTSDALDARLEREPHDPTTSMQRVSPGTGVDIGATMRRNNENGFETLDVLFILLIIFCLLGVMLMILL